MGAYAYVCHSCDHLATQHRLAKGGDLHAGPYNCMDCACSGPQDLPVYELTKSGYETYLSQGSRTGGVGAGAGRD